MDIFLNHPRNAKYAENVFNDLKQVASSSSNIVFSYSEPFGDVGAGTYFEIYNKNTGFFIFKCTSGIVQTDNTQIILPNELSKKLYNICAQYAVKQPDTTKFQVSQLSAYLKRFQDKSI